MTKENKNKIPRGGKSVVMRLGAGAALLSLCLSLSTVRPSAEGVHTDGTGTYAYSYGRGMMNESADELTESYSEAESRVARRKIQYNLPGIPSRYLSSYRQLDIKLNGVTLSQPAVVVNGIGYVPLRLVGETVAGAKVSYNKSTRTATLTANGLSMSIADGGYVIYANNRPLFSFSPSILMSNGRMYVPASALFKALGITYSGFSDTAVTLTGSYKPLKSASSYYREDEVYWLSKIISAESSGESLLGQIAVGDVIMNRVKSNAYPNTIYSVIFDKKYGVQFSPTADGRIYANATYTATLAAKICLEGISLSDDAMYFLNPKVAESNWIVKNREYTYTIGNHDFYK